MPWRGQADALIAAEEASRERRANGSKPSKGSKVNTNGSKNRFKKGFPRANKEGLPDPLEVSARCAALSLSNEDSREG